MTHNCINIAKQSRLGYMKALNKAKACYWANFLSKTSAQNIWTANQFIALRNTPGFPSLPGATDPVAIKKAHLDQFFLAKNLLPQRGDLSCDAMADPLTSNEIRHALSKSLTSSAPAWPGIPYPVLTKVPGIYLEILLDLLWRLLGLGYHPPSLEITNGVLLATMENASYNSPTFFGKIVLPKIISKIVNKLSG